MRRNSRQPNHNTALQTWRRRGTAVATATAVGLILVQACGGDAPKPVDCNHTMQVDTDMQTTARDIMDETGIDGDARTVGNAMQREYSHRTQSQIVDARTVVRACVMDNDTLGNWQVIPPTELLPPSGS